ncbi:hypothetical protein E8F11_13495 [Pseudomonas sp. BN417]|uniref:hypothetical protein n=1 Tax=Pseudomonas sp. BN417 TaxID=2567890 RepID=UPI002456C3BD|nr:hypothetical protein [Pseudomonas sp. BN417]MDH4556174.1 hypothetical protein [Pseudomonas sp. BN417]
MQQRLRIHYTESQKALMWDRWKQGDSLQQIALTTGKAIGAAFSRCLDGAVGTVDAGGKEKGKGGVLKVHICALSIAAWSRALRCIGEYASHASLTRALQCCMETGMEVGFGAKLGQKRHRREPLQTGQQSWEADLKRVGAAWGTGFQGSNPSLTATFRFKQTPDIPSEVRGFCFLGFGV